MSDSALFKVFAACTTEQAAALGGIGSADWARAVEDTAQHQCAPMFRQRLRKLGILDRMSDDVRRRLMRLARETALRNLGGTRQLVELTDRMRGVPLIALKGACLARTCYGDVSLRPMRDLDLLARESDLGLARQALEQLGYRQSLRTAPELNSIHDPPYFKKGTIHIELHRSLLDPLDPFTIDYAALWSRAAPAKGIPGLFYLSAEDQLLHVCLHAGYHHRFDIGLYAFMDIAMLAGGTQLDWRTFSDRAREWNAERCVFLTLEMARMLVGATVPADVMAALRPADVDAGIIPMAIAVVRNRYPQGYEPSAFLSKTIADLVFGRGWLSIPGRLKRRFLRKPERRTQWQGSPHGASWYGQLAPLLEGVIGLARHRVDRQRLVASLKGARVRRWMTHRDAAASR